MTLPLYEEHVNGFGLWLVHQSRAKDERGEARTEEELIALAKRAYPDVDPSTISRFISSLRNLLGGMCSDHPVAEAAAAA